MSQIDDGGSAFPVAGGCVSSPGMSLRDWFAGQEQIGDNENFRLEIIEALVGPAPSGDCKTNPLEWFNWSNKWQAVVRYARADAMLAARKGGAE